MRSNASITIRGGAVRTTKILEPSSRHVASGTVLRIPAHRPATFALASDSDDVMGRVDVYLANP